MVSEKGLKEIRRTIEGKKGINLAEILEKYLPCFSESNAKNYLQLLELAKNPKYSTFTIKNLAMHLENSKVYSPDINKLLHNLFDPVLYSADHVIPQSRGGVNSYYNLVPMHRSCNTQRSSESYGELVQKAPQILTNLKKAIYFIQERILSDKAGKTSYRINIPEDYVSKVINSLIQEGVNKEFMLIG